MSPAIEITAYRRPKPGENLFLIGPGGVGKSTLAIGLAPLGYPAVDLDLEFRQRLGVIGPFIVQHGYDAYRAANLELAEWLLDRVTQPAIVVTSSGFLAASPMSADYRRALALVHTGYSISLLPSLDVDEATSITVARQMSRGFNLDLHRETDKFRARFPIYRDIGDMRVVSAAPPDQIADAVMFALGGSPTPAGG